MASSWKNTPQVTLYLEESNHGFHYTVGLGELCWHNFEYNSRCKHRSLCWHSEELLRAYLQRKIATVSNYNIMG